MNSDLGPAAHAMRTLRCQSLAIFAGLVALVASGVSASGLAVKPIRVELLPGQSIDVAVTNGGSGDITVRAWVSSWSQIHDQDVLLETGDISLASGMLRLAPGKSLPVTVTDKSEATNLERSYRLFIEEAAGRDTDPSGLVGMRINISLPIFITVPGARADLHWQLQSVAGHPKLIIRNDGSKHAQVLRFSLINDKGATVYQQRLSQYVLPKSSRSADLDAEPNGAVTTAVRIIGITDQGQFEAAVESKSALDRKP